MNHPFSSVLESLESRLAPAGLVAISTAGGVLSINGDGLDNHIQVTESSPGEWSISDAFNGGDTLFTLNGGAASASITVDVAQSIKATLNAGDDTLNLDGIHLNGGLTILGNDGNDNVTLGGSRVNGATLVDLGKGDDAFTSIDSVMNGAVSLKTGAGNDTVEILSSSLNKGLTVDLGTESNVFRLSDGVEGGPNHIFGNVSVKATGSILTEQTFDLTPSNGYIAGNVSLSATAGTTRVNLGLDTGDSLQITGGLAIKTGAGDDTFTLLGGISIGGQLSIAAGDGTNVLTTEISETPAAFLSQLTAGSFKYTGGKGADEVSFSSENITIGDSFNFAGGAGDNFVEINLPSLTEGAAESTALHIGGALIYSGTTGTDFLEIGGDQAVIGGQLSFSGGNATNAAYFQPLAGSIGSVKYAGGTGNDSLEIGGYEEFVEEGTSFFDLSEATVQGNIATSFGTGGANFSLIGTTVNGSLTHVSSAAAAMDDSVRIYSSNILGVTNVNTSGAADALVDIQGSLFRSAFNASTGAGNDSVFLGDGDGLGRVDVAVNTFRGAVKIILGAGDDVFGAGRAPASPGVLGNDFLSTVSLDGGAGIDSADFEPGYGNTFASPAIKINFEPGV